MHRGWLGRLGLESAAETLGEDLSYGQQKLLCLARLLATEADVLLLDEPTAGINPETIRIMIPILREAARSGKTLVVIEHNLNYVLEEADWAFFLEDGPDRRLRPAPRDPRRPCCPTAVPGTMM